MTTTGRESVGQSRQLAYLDSVSCESLQQYDPHFHRITEQHGVIDLTEEWLLGQLEREWEAEASRHHWQYVTEPVPIEPQEHGHDQGHEGWTVEDFIAVPTAADAGLTRSEVLSLRLYTGAGFGDINASCRRADGLFAVTTFLCNRAIAKIARNQRHNPDFPTTFYRGIRGRMRIPFHNIYHQPNCTPDNLSRLTDPGLFSTTSDIRVATLKYGGDILFVISKIGSGLAALEGTLNDAGYELMSTPAPVKWVSQYPCEEEFLWPTFTALIPRLPSERANLSIDPSWPNTKHVYEFTPMYLWDTTCNCVGRWQNIEESELEMAKTTALIAAYGMGMQDAWMSIPGLLVDQEMDGDYTKEQVVSIAFSMFDRSGSWLVQWSDIEDLIRTFYGSLERPEEEVNRIVGNVQRELMPLFREDGLHWKEFRDHFCAKEYGAI